MTCHLCGHAQFTVAVEIGKPIFLKCAECQTIVGEISGIHPVREDLDLSNLELL
jgi:hypothetical protein